MKICGYTLVGTMFSPPDSMDLMYNYGFLYYMKSDI
jgi:hypothetical protein